MMLAEFVWGVDDLVGGIFVVVMVLILSYFKVEEWWKRD